jgi:CheY-like chemotaxis protein
MLIYACADLIFSTRIRAACDDLKTVSRPARNLDMLSARLNRVDDGKPNFPVSCVMIDLDLGDDALGLIRAVKAHDANIPVVAFGAHVAVELLQAAKEAGADFVMPRGVFTAQLSTLISRFTKPG